MIYRNKFFIVLLLMFALFVIPTGRVYAATLSFQPAAVSVSADNIFTINVVVDTEGKIINNVETKITFPKDLLEAVSIDKRASIFSLWVEDPSFSNNTGEITLNGGAPNPGFQGSNGKIVSVVFKAKKSGTASVFFTDSAVRENDGLGTDILSGKTSLNVSIAAVAAAPAPQPAVSANNSAPVITSPTHPNENAWYSSGDVVLNWILPKNAVAVKTSLGSNPDSDTNVLYKSAITTKNIKDLKEGIWYFHVNYLTSSGWSKIGTYKIQIDKTGPTDVSINTSKDETGKVDINIQAKDELSGVDRYSVQVDSDTPFNIKADALGNASSSVPILTIGEHNIQVKVYDKAGNLTEKNVVITTDVATAVSIDSYPAKIKVGESIEVSGTAPYADAALSVSIKKDDLLVESYRIKSDDYLKFHFRSQPVKEKGVYTLWVDVLRGDGSVAASSQKVTIIAVKPLLIQIGSYTTELLTVLIPAVILLLALLFILYYGWHKFFGVRRRVKKDFDQMQERVHRAFKTLSAETAEQLALLEKSRKKAKLSADEEGAIKELKDAIAQVDLYIETEMKKISDDDLG